MTSNSTGPHAGRRRIPKKLYKYQPASIQALANLTAGKIWFADPFSFNDPFDCALESIDRAIQSAVSETDTATFIEILQQGNLPDEVIKTVLQMPENDIRRIASGALVKQIPLIFDRGVCCFSEKNDNMLMWGHYAECHRGYCLEFTTQFPPFNVASKLHRVAYRDKFPHFEPKRIAKGDFDHFLDFLLAKAKYWSYEREWRLLHQEKRKLYGYKRRCLTAVYLGAKMSEELTHLIGTAVENMPTKLFRAKLKKDEFGLDFEPVTYKSIDYRSDGANFDMSIP